MADARIAPLTCLVVKGFAQPHGFHSRSSALVTCESDGCQVHCTPDLFGRQVLLMVSILVQAPWSPVNRMVVKCIAPLTYLVVRCLALLHNLTVSILIQVPWIPLIQMAGI